MVWLTVLAFVLFLGFLIAVMVCVQAIKRKTEIIIKSRLHHRLSGSEVIYANAGLIGVVLLVIFHIYIFVPALLMFVLFIVLSDRIESGLTKDGAIVGTTFIDWEFMRGYSLENKSDNDSNVIVLKLRANRHEYILICERNSREEIKDIMKKNKIRAINN